MDVVKNFIVENWQMCLMIILALANLLVAMFRKRTKVFDSVKEFITKNLPVLILEAEKLFNDGSLKKQYVIEHMSALLANSFPLVKVEAYQKFIGDLIELFLSLPTKKGLIKNEEKN